MLGRKGWDYYFGRIVYSLEWSPLRGTEREGGRETPLDFSLSTICYTTDSNQSIMIAIVLLLSLLATAANAISASELVGTWTTKSRSVITGPVGGQED